MNYWKLIELLNEFDQPLGRYYEDWVLDCKLNFYEYIAYEWVCSARYWFIEWLVENEKIDFSKVKEKIWLERELYDRMLYWYKETDFLIMLLSIQNEPIEFLISILK